jgi:DNA-binding response OmpR family regulator
MKKILIVDDDVGIRELVDTTLKSEDYHIFQAGTGQEAIEITRAEKPDVIIMDILMPGGTDGVEATRILKNDPETRGSTIIILSGIDQEVERQKGLEAGADDYFTKPFSPLALIRKVEEVLG